MHPFATSSNHADTVTYRAEVGLLTPSAVIVADPSFQLPDNTVFAETKVQWGKEHSHDYERKDIR